MAALVVLVDQAVKLWAVSALQLNESLPVISGVFHLTLTHNTGVAFGMAQGKGILTIPISILVMGGILYFRRHLPGSPRWRDLALSLLFGGALANLIDRLRLGYVIDMFDFQVWPVFNVADSAITVAILMLIAMQLLPAKSHSPAQPLKETNPHDADPV